MKIAEVVAWETDLRIGYHPVAAVFFFPPVVKCLCRRVDSVTLAKMIGKKPAMLGPRVRKSHPTHRFLENFDFFFRPRSTRSIVWCSTWYWRR